MTLVSRLVLGVACLVVTSGASALTLPEAQRMAQENNPELRAQMAEVEADDASLTRTWSRFLPSFGVESRYEYFDSTFEMRRGGTGNLFAEWNVFNGFKDYSARQERRLSLEATKLRLEQLRRSVSWDVEVAFSKVLMHQEMIRIVNEAIARNDSLMKMARQRRSAGMVSDADVLEFDLHDALLRSELATLEGDLKGAQTELRVVLGATDVQFPLTGELGRFKVLDTQENVGQRVQKANVDLGVLQLGIEEAKARKVEASGGFLPQVRLFATHGSLGLRETMISPETYAGVVARWELFSGLDTVGARREAAARLAQVETALRSARISTSGEAEQAFTHLKALEYRVQLEATNSKSAERYFRVVLDEYRRGVKNSPDVKSASENFYEALTSDIRHRFKFLEEKVKLQKLMNQAIETTVADARPTGEKK